jgi:hypothetical protein
VERLQLHVNRLTAVLVLWILDYSEVDHVTCCSGLHDPTGQGEGWQIAIGDGCKRLLLLLQCCWETSTAAQCWKHSWLL